MGLAAWQNGYKFKSPGGSWWYISEWTHLNLTTFTMLTFVTFCFFTVTLIQNSILDLMWSLAKEGGAGGAGAELPATPSVTCGEQSWVHTVSTHLLERRHEVREGFLYFISDLIALKTWQYHKELLSQSSRVWPSMIVTFKKIMTIQSHDMTILMMDVWDGHTHLGDRKCGGIFGLNWPPLWLLFSILFSS